MSGELFLAIQGQMAQQEEVWHSKNNLQQHTETGKLTKEYIWGCDLLYCDINHHHRGRTSP
jgi:hypothetical protein